MCVCVCVWVGGWMEGWHVRDWCAWTRTCFSIKHPGERLVEGGSKERGIYVCM